MPGLLLRALPGSIGNDIKPVFIFETHTEKSLGWSPTPGFYAGDARRARQPPKNLVFDEDTFGFVAHRRGLNARRYRRGHVAQRIVLRINTLHA